MTFFISEVLDLQKNCKYAIESIAHIQFPLVLTSYIIMVYLLQYGMYF